MKKKKSKVEISSKKGVNITVYLPSLIEIILLLELLGF